MKSREPIVINLNVDLRVIAVLALLIGLLAAGYVASGAQGDNPPTINDMQGAPSATRNTPVRDPMLAPPTGMKDPMPTLNGEWLPLASAGAAPDAHLGPVPLSAAGLRRHFYLTQANYHANQTLAACASGYHMASLWEILDVSNLVYDGDQPEAYHQTDDGGGPPSGWWGWVRTGQDGSSVNVAGSGNCLSWSSIAGADYGTAVRLSDAWETAPGDISTWDADSFTCDILGPVWCVRN